MVDDTELEQSFKLAIETVPTLIRLEGGRETGRRIGWHRGEWEDLSGIKGWAANCRTSSRAAAPRASSPACRNA